MTTIKSASTFILLIASLLKASSIGILDAQSFQKIFDNLYFQPYPEFSKQALYHRYNDFDSWQPPSDKKIVIQIGHLLEEELPLELIYLGKDGGAKINRVKEVEINKMLAEKTKIILEKFFENYNNDTEHKMNYEVEINNAILPVDYYADVFVSIHSNIDKKNVSGFLVGTPYKDYSEKSVKLKNTIIKEYKKSTGMKFIDYQSARMTHYYSFNWSKFKRAIHPKTPSVIFEAGNLNNFNDLIILTLNQDKAAKGIANGIIRFINENEK